MKMTREEYFQDNLKNTKWLGEVMDNEDPEFTGKIKVKVFGKFDDLETDDIPWAYPAVTQTGGSNSGGGFHSVPKVGSIVSVTFDNGNIYHPEYHFNQQISNELKEEIKESYPNSHSLIYDTEAQPGAIKVFFTEEKGLMIEYNNSQVNIRPDNTIFLRYGENGKVFHVLENDISIGTEDESDEPAVLGDTLYDLLNSFITELGKQTALLSPYGPCQAFNTMPTWAPMVAKFKVDFKKFRSDSITLDGPSKKT